MRDQSEVNQPIRYEGKGDPKQMYLCELGVELGLPWSMSGVNRPTNERSV